MLAAGYGSDTAKQMRIRWTDAGGKRRLVSPRNHPVVAKHLAEMQAVGRERAAVTIASITDELEEARTLAKEELNAGAMVRGQLAQVVQRLGAHLWTLPPKRDHLDQLAGIGRLDWLRLSRNQRQDSPSNAEARSSRVHAFVPTAPQARRRRRASSVTTSSTSPLQYPPTP